MNDHEPPTEGPSGEQYLAELQERLVMAGQAFGFELDPDGEAEPIERIIHLSGAIAGCLDALSQRPELFTHPAFLTWSAESYSWAAGEILPTTLIRPALTYRLQVLCQVIQPHELPTSDPLTGAAVAAMRAVTEILAASVTADTAHALFTIHHRRAAEYLAAATAHLAEASGETTK